MRVFMSMGSKHLGKRVVPCEPYRAASGSRKSKEKDNAPPGFPSHLIPYELGSNFPARCRPDNLLDRFNLLHQPTNGSAKRLADDKKQTDDSGPQTEFLLSQLRSLHEELDVEREVNRELKNLLVNALTDDLNCKMSSLAEDKVRLARNIDSYHKKVNTDAETHDHLAIENSLWRSKFMAVSIKADDLSFNLHQSLRLFKRAQVLLACLRDKLQGRCGELHESICGILNVDVLSLYNKTLEPVQTRTSNLTITCCTRCADKEILLV